MTLALTEDEHMIADAAGRLFAERAPVARLRKYRDAGDAHRHDPALWRTMTELGFADTELNLAQRCVLAEAAGAVLASEPLGTAFFALDLLGAHPLARAIGLGRARVATAWDERGLAQPTSPRAFGRPSGERVDVTGEKRQVEHALEATHFLVTATVGGAFRLVLIQTGAGVDLIAADRVDLHPAATARFQDAPGELMPSVDAGAFERALDRAAIVHCAGMLGAAQRAFEMTLDYLKTRQQFGVAIGSFQALQHRAARLYVELALTRSAVSRAARAEDESLPLFASIAKVRCGETFLRVAEEAIQMHGGIGMTDEHDIGLYLKRAMVAEHLFGNSDAHRRRFARLSGF